MLIALLGLVVIIKLSVCIAIAAIGLFIVDWPSLEINVSISPQALPTVSHTAFIIMRFRAFYTN